MGNLVIQVAHDFTCPWCWVALFQAKRLQAEFGVEIEWLGYELWPEELEWPESRPAMPAPLNRPPILSRFEFLKLMDGVDVPDVDRPKGMRVHASLEAVEYLKEHSPGAAGSFVEDVYRAYWERGEAIGEIDVICRLLAPYLSEPVQAARQALEERRYRDNVVHFDAPSYKLGIFNVPTFFIGGERLAEQPYVVLRRAVGDLLPSGSAEPLSDVYAALSFPPAPAGRPYVYIDMVATIDGKILSGSRDEPVVDLGSANDHRLMERIEAASQAVLLGAQTLRAAKKSWNPCANTRIVVTSSGDLPLDSCFFSGNSIVAVAEAERSKVESALRRSDRASPQTLTFSDLDDLLEQLRGRGIERLLVLGGSTLNAELFENGLVDEIFITVAPKIKLGSDVPTIAGGNALPRESIQNYSIVEEHRIGDELFLRYRRRLEK